MSPSSFLTGGNKSGERRDNNNGKMMLSPDTMKSSDGSPTVPTSIAPLAQSIIGSGRGRSSSGRGRGRGGGGGGATHATSANSSDPYNGRDKVPVLYNVFVVVDDGWTLQGILLKGEVSLYY